MKRDSLTRRDVQTRLGVVPLWNPPEALSGSRPLVLGIQGMFAGPDDLAGLPDALSHVADVALVQTPRAGATLGDGSLAAFAQAVGELIDGFFPVRPVVLLGVSLGATAAFAVRASSLRRIVAVEPLLTTAGLWPILAPLRRQLAVSAGDLATRELVWRHFGVAEDATTPCDHRWLLEGLSVPADVVLGGEPLEPRRELSRFPSLVGAADRATLAAHRQVRLHVAPQAGHNVQSQAPLQVKELVLEACRRAAAEPAFDLHGLDEPLMEAPRSPRAASCAGAPAGARSPGATCPGTPTRA